MIKYLSLLLTIIFLSCDENSIDQSQLDASRYKFYQKGDTTFGYANADVFGKNWSGSCWYEHEGGGPDNNDECIIAFYTFDKDGLSTREEVLLGYIKVEDIILNKNIFKIEQSGYSLFTADGDVPSDYKYYTDALYENSLILTNYNQEKGFIEGRFTIQYKLDMNTQGKHDFEKVPQTITYTNGTFRAHLY